MNWYRVPLILTVLLQGCSSNMFHSDHYPSRFSEYGYGYEPKQNILSEQPSNANSFKILKKYADRIANELSFQVEVESIVQLGVASFVELDDNLTSSNALGNKLAETLIISLREVGFSVKELNLSTAIEINEKGNFIFDRTHQSQQLAPYMVSGIINYTQTGATINSRLIQTKNAQILAVNSLFLPNFMLKNEFPLVEGSNLFIKTE